MSFLNIDMPLHEAADLRVGEPPLHMTKPDEMRKAMMRAARHSLWIRRAFDIADVEGYSGEDRYVLLAFHLALENERRQHFELRRAMLEPRTVIPAGTDLV